MTDQLAVGYEGTEPFPGSGSTPRTFGGGVRIAVTAAIVIVPFSGLAVAAARRPHPGRAGCTGLLPPAWTPGVASGVSPSCARRSRIARR